MCGGDRSTSREVRFRLSSQSLPTRIAIAKLYFTCAEGLPRHGVVPWVPRWHPSGAVKKYSFHKFTCVCVRVYACLPRWHPSGAFEYTRRRHLSRHCATDTDWRANDTLRTLHSARANLTQARQPPLSESARFRPTKPDNEGISLYCAQDYNPISGPTSSTNQSSEFRVYSSLE